MSLIEVKNLTFRYDSSYDNIFENVSFRIDSSWKLGFVGRNGKGKTTFLNLLQNKYEYRGIINSSVNFDYFPYIVNNSDELVINVLDEVWSDYELWKVMIEFENLNLSQDILYQQYSLLSNGEQTKVLLAVLFSKDNNFLLIDEPTNHLDVSARKEVAKYLKSKEGFILVSHDRDFLDATVDYILALNRSSIDVVQGNFTTWYENKVNQNKNEMKESQRLKHDIARLEVAGQRASGWANKVEKNKRSTESKDSGYAGHKAAKMMKRVKAIENRREKAIEEKSKLLKDVETTVPLKIFPQKHYKNTLIQINDLSIEYDGRQVLNNFNLTVQQGEKILLRGKNGCGKSSLIKSIIGETAYKGEIKKASQLQISYIPQDASFLSGSIKEFVLNNGLDATILQTVLRHLGFERIQFEKMIEDYSEGQKKKLLLAKSLCEKAHIYIWDEPLNYVDIFTRIEIEELIRNYDLTMLVIEHDELFNKNLNLKEVFLS